MNGPVRRVLVALGLVAVLAGPAAARVVVIQGAEIDETITSAPQGQVSDRQIRMIDAGGMNLGVGVVHRPVIETLTGIQHHRQAEIYRVVTGRGVLATASALTDARELDPNGAVVRTLTGQSAVGGIQDGVSQPVGPGDVVFIPAGIAHGFSSITEPITYIVHRIDSDRLVELKERRP